MSESAEKVQATEDDSNGAEWKWPTLFANTEPVTSGPYRYASQPGAFVTLFELRDVRAKLESLDEDNVQATIDSQAATLGGYTVGIQCKLQKDDKGAIRASFIICIRCGEWDSYLDWPFAKKLTVILSHTDGQDKDLKLPISTSDESEMVKKPAPGCCNKGHKSQPVNWEEIESKGFVLNNTLYVNVELE